MEKSKVVTILLTVTVLAVVILGVGEFFLNSKMNEINQTITDISVDANAIKKEISNIANATTRIERNMFDINDSVARVERKINQAIELINPNWEITLLSIQDGYKFFCKDNKQDLFEGACELNKKKLVHTNFCFAISAGGSVTNISLQNENLLFGPWIDSDGVFTTTLRGEVKILHNQKVVATIKISPVK